MGYLVPTTDRPVSRPFSPIIPHRRQLTLPHPIPSPSPLPAPSQNPPKKKKKKLQPARASQQTPAVTLSITPPPGPYIPHASMSRIRHAICARRAASASRLAVARKGEASSAAPVVPGVSKLPRRCCGGKKAGGCGEVVVEVWREERVKWWWW